MITSAFPIITTPDLGRALGFYRDLLGGRTGYEFPGPDGKPAYVGLDLGSSHLGIGLAPPEQAPPPQRAISLWIYTDECDALVERLRAVGVRITEDPTDQPWGERVARVLDPDGNEVIIGQRGADGS
jgi:lactoylglutathione lyase